MKLLIEALNCIGCKLAFVACAGFSIGGAVDNMQIGWGVFIGLVAIVDWKL